MNDLDMTAEELKKTWKDEEDCAFIKGWDFSHIHGRYEEEDSLPWDYEEIIRSVLKDEMKLLDYDTGGGEFLLKLNHPYKNTAATEGYPPNVVLCKERLSPLGIDIRECKDSSNIPFDDEAFDIIINRHGDFYPEEIKRLLKPGGMFITQQVGSDNDRELVKMVLPEAEKPFSHYNLLEQKQDLLMQVLRSCRRMKPLLRSVFTTSAPSFGLQGLSNGSFRDFLSTAALTGSLSCRKPLNGTE
jgi:SAM-dependent methyltransferase